MSTAASEGAGKVADRVKDDINTPWLVQSETRDRHSERIRAVELALELAQVNQRHQLDVASVEDLIKASKKIDKFIQEGK